MSRSWAGGSTRRWRRVRSLAFLAHGRACSLAIPGVCTEWADQAHHTRGRAATGDDLRYVRPACAACNQATGDPTAPGPDPRPRPRTKW